LWRSVEAAAVVVLAVAVLPPAGQTPRRERDYQRPHLMHVDPRHFFALADLCANL
jgi:hypothetical protein